MQDEEDEDFRLPRAMLLGDGGQERDALLEQDGGGRCFQWTQSAQPDGIPV
ncbi:hypothetical protein ACJ2CR_35025 [Myxococcus faecalis]|uniref:hypothetical protein n=1 Tax=Myxococcus faecalis TaxID=3115646 RepID=UPI0038D14587